jgi:hypothetical protein
MTAPEMDDDLITGHEIKKGQLLRGQEVKRRAPHLVLLLRLRK